MAWSSTLLKEATVVFPSLKLENGALRGRLSFRGKMKNGSLLLFPSSVDCTYEEDTAGLVLDSYVIELFWDAEKGYPILRLLGNRVTKLAESRGRPIVDFHLFGDQSACYCARQEIAEIVDKKLSPVQFLDQYVRPYLFGQAHLEKYGSWPWKELSHGFLGTIEWLGSKQEMRPQYVSRTVKELVSSPPDSLPLIRQLLSKRVRLHHLCPCGSEKVMKHCHPEYKRAIDELRKWMFEGCAEQLRSVVIGKGEVNGGKLRISPYKLLSVEFNSSTTI